MKHHQERPQTTRERRNMGHRLESTNTNNPTILSTQQPNTTTSQVPRTRNELDGMHRRCMPNTLERQGKHLLSTTTKPIGCCSLRMGTNIRSTATSDGTLGVQQRNTHWPKDNQRGTRKKEGTTHSDPLDEVLPRQVLDPQGRKGEKSALPQETSTWRTKRKGMGKGREDMPFGGGE